MGGHAKDTPESIAAKAADRPRLDRDFMVRLDALRAQLRMQLYQLGLRSSPDEDPSLEQRAEAAQELRRKIRMHRKFRRLTW